MIPKTLVETITNRVAIEFRERRNVISKEVGGIKEAMSARGVLFSSITMHEIVEAIAREYETRAFLAWNTWARGLSATKSLVTAELGQTLKGWLSRHLEEECDDLVKHFDDGISLMGGAGGSGKDVSEIREKAIDKIHSEIDFGLMEATGSASESDTASTFNFYSPIGVVQTGAGSTASVQMSFGENERGQLIKALEAVERAVKEATASSEAINELLEVLTEARSEASQSRPNMTRLRGVIAGIGTSVRTLGASPAAYELLKGAAATIGLQLP